MSLFDGIFNGLNGLNGSVGQNLDNNPVDIKKTERALNRTGYFNGDYSEGFITSELDKGIRAFQRDNNLKTDGIMHPNGETEQALFGNIKHAQNSYILNIQEQQKSNILMPDKKPVTPERYHGSFSLNDAPVVNMEKDRIESILNNTPAKFEIRGNEKLNTPEPDEKFKQNYIKNENIGNQYVKTHEKDIEVLSRKHDIDPDLVKAVMWSENARGHNFGVNELLDSIGYSDTQAPMNISGKIWSGLINKTGSRLDNEKDNIEAGIILLKRIQDRVVNPTPEKIGSIWNFTGRENTNEIGLEIENAYRTKPWQKKN